MPSDPSASTFRRRRWPTCAGAWRRPGCPRRRPSPIFSQGVPLKTIQQVLRYWQTDYDWRKVEARLNAVPNFITEIDGLDIHFIHVRSKHENALPLIVTHGWPGSIIEQLKIIEPLTNPTAHGGSASDAFHLVIPSMPGYGFSGKPTTTGWGPERIARAWTTLMRRLGYKHFVAQGGDWGAVVVDLMGVQAPPELLGIHTNMPGAVPAEIDQACVRRCAGAGRSLRRGEKLVRTARLLLQACLLRPHDGNAPANADRVCGLAHRPGDLPARPRCAQSGAHRALVRRADRRSDTRRCPRQRHAVLADQHRGFGGSPLLGGFTPLKLAFFSPKGVKVPVAVSAFPDELYQTPRSWAERAYPNLIHYNKLEKGGHFAAWEQPKLFTEELRAGFRSLRK